MQYGKDNESTAVNNFVIDIRRQIPDIHVHSTGFRVNKEYPQLGCSPDGIAVNRDEIALIEVKCPWTLRNSKPIDFATCLSKTQLHSFCLAVSDGVISLKRNRKYFFQVQMQMCVMGVSQCYFIIWSEKGVWWEK